MTPTTQIAPTDLRDYAKSEGWVLLQEAISDRLYVMSHPTLAQRQLVFPMDAEAAGYADAVASMIDKLADIEGRPADAIVKSLSELRDDGVTFRVSTPAFDEAYLPLTLASSMVAGAEQLLRAAACTVLKPRTHHPRLSRSEAQALLDVARFRHTSPGSFVLSVSCPVHAIEAQSALAFGEDRDPFVRRVTTTMKASLQNLVRAIETDALDSFVDEARRSETPLISSNLCEAITRFGDETLKNAVDIGFRWAPVLPPPVGEPRVTTVRIQRDYFARIEEVRRALRPSEDHIEDAFVGTVERLDGEMSEDGRRSGEVILSLLLPEGEQVRVRTNLDADQYARADRAHMSEGAYVMVTGRLHPGRQPRLLSALRTFDLVQRPDTRHE